MAKKKKPTLVISCDRLLQFEDVQIEPPSTTTDHGVSADGQFEFASIDHPLMEFVDVQVPFNEIPQRSAKKPKKAIAKNGKAKSRLTKTRKPARGKVS